MTPAIAPEDALAVDPGGLARYLAATLPHYGGEFGVRRLGQGQSCLTFMVEGDGWRVVLRRPPRGDLPPSAFDVTREYRVMNALHENGAPVPVPPPVMLCTDTAVIGAPFYLMEPVDGLVVRTELPDALASMEDRAAMADALLDTLSALQAIDYQAVGLEGFGKPDGYLERQLRRMNQLWELARFRDVPDIETVGKWLAENIPTQRRATIVHGDYKLDNVIFAPASPARLIAVVDWEMSTLGDPMADLGWMLYWWRDPGDASFGLTVSSVMDRDGFPRRRELLAGYADATGEDVSAIDWYAALGGWKIAIIMEGSYRRFKAGITDHPLFAELEWGVPALAARSAAAMRGELGLR
ncbi:MAG TPA: phosphotransferase family protein [Actinomycetota bacterium]